MRLNQEYPRLARLLVTVLVRTVSALVTCLEAKPSRVGTSMLSESRSLWRSFADLGLGLGHAPR